MNTFRCAALVGSCTVLLGGLVGLARADEGMWLFNDPPLKLLADRYQFQPTPQWLEHLQRAAVRFNSGGSGSFVSSTGLVMTNHHVGADALQKLSTPHNDLLKHGFHARTREEELRCVDLELNVLMSIEDVTARVEGAVRPEMSAAEAFAARRAMMSTIEQESLTATGLRSDVVTLYHGGLYHLYRYRRYTDVRLVFAPEQSIAFFGGDPDNFEYPRYCLDVCFFRVYEDGQPIAPPDFLRWSEKGVSDGELVFVAGHPGRTDRLDTMAHLEFLRDRVFPDSLDRLRRQEVLLSTFSERSQENARRAQDDLFGIANSRKARLGALAGLQDPEIMNRKWAEEQALRKAVKAKPALQQTAGAAWNDVEAALTTWNEIYRPLTLYEGAAAFNSTLFDYARTLVRMAAEDAKPNAERLREFRQSNRDSLEQWLYSEAPLYHDLETLKLADSLSLLVETQGTREPLLREILAGQSPRNRAAALIEGTGLFDVAERKRLAAGGMAAIEASKDPLIALALLVDPESRRVRTKYDEQVDEPLRQAYGKIAQARFDLYGTDVYPDATFTLRLSLGTVGGYEEQGRRLPPWTVIGGAFARAAEHDNRAPFELPESWLRSKVASEDNPRDALSRRSEKPAESQSKSRLNLQTPLNFVSTNDIIGGNSGSPVVNRQGEVVGLIFDGNLQSLIWDYIYDDAEGRSLAVDVRGIVEALRNIYDATPLVEELGK